MPTDPYDSAAEYDAEYQRVRAAFVVRGTSLNRWIADRGLNRQIVYRALRGQSFGPKARSIRAEILRAAFGGAN
jgi:hypothetical protein